MTRAIIPILPSRSLAVTEAFYGTLGFTTVNVYPNYLLLVRDGCELHFFLHPELDPLANDHGAYIRIAGPADLPAGAVLEVKPWGMREFALIDPDGNLLRFGAKLEST